MVVGDAHVFLGFLISVLTQLSFQSHQLLSSHASAEVRGKNTLDRKFASNGSGTQNHQVMSPTVSTEPPSQGDVICESFCSIKCFLERLGKYSISLDFVNNNFPKNEAMSFQASFCCSLIAENIKVFMVFPCHHCLQTLTFSHIFITEDICVRLGLGVQRRTNSIRTGSSKHILALLCPFFD